MGHAKHSPAFEAMMDQVDWDLVRQQDDDALLAAVAWVEAPTPAPVAVTDADVEWQRGWALYELGASDGECVNRHQMRGWWDACEADSQRSPILDLSHARWGDISDDYDDIRYPGLI